MSADGCGSPALPTGNYVWSAPPYERRSAIPTHLGKHQPAQPEDGHDRDQHPSGGAATASFIGGRISVNSRDSGFGGRRCWLRCQHLGPSQAPPPPRRSRPALPEIPSATTARPRPHSSCGPAEPSTPRRARSRYREPRVGPRVMTSMQGVFVLMSRCRRESALGGQGQARSRLGK